METKKLLTIVIPTYNVEKYLARTLDSLLTETDIYDDLELIVVNDGSKDRSLEIAREYEANYPGVVKVVDKENGGHGSTINVGMKIATGKYFRVIDSDDWVNVDHFARYVRELRGLDVDIVLTNYSREMIYEGHQFYFTYSNNIEYDTVYDLNTFDFKRFGWDYFFMATSTFKTEKLRKANFELDENTFYVDMEFILLPFLEYESFIYLDYDIYRYFIGRDEQSISLVSMVKRRDNHEKVLRRLLAFYKDSDISENRKEYYQSILTGMLKTHYIIYTQCQLPEPEAINEIKEIDKLLLAEFPELHKMLCDLSPVAAWNSKTGFKYAQKANNKFARYAELKASLGSKLHSKFGKKGDR